jgi:uncharacterized protein
MATTTSISSDAPAPRPAPLTSPLVTIALVILLVGLSLSGAHSQEPFVARHGRIALYAMSAGFEWVIVLVLWFFLRRSGRTMREVIGGRWSSPEDVLLDVALAAGFWIVSSGVLVALAYVMGMAKPGNLESARGATSFLMPHSPREAAMWPLLTLTAGFCEEFIYRGYLQKQIGILAQSAWVGMIASSVIFGLSHGYQGPKLMMVITVYGMCFALLAHFRKSTRPGMMAHAWQDSLAGLLRYALRMY